MPSGQNDNSFGQGTQENDTNAPTIIAGSIPNNKSDLMWFGGYQEPSSPKTLELFWSRVQSPEGTTNMDFELNQKACPGSCSANGVTPVRTAGDKLITYDLSKGGTVPSISIRQWLGSVWGPADVVSDGANPTALGAVNTSSIAANDSGGIGALDAFTFGEAAISYQALFGGSTGCTTLGSVYVKSRSSDSFNAELKDFIAPRPITVSNCTTISHHAVVDLGLRRDSAHDSATLGNATADAGGTVTYTVYSNNACTQGARDAGTKTVTNGVVPDSNGLTFPTPPGLYWQASYSGDANNAASKSACTDEHLVVLAPEPEDLHPEGARLADRPERRDGGVHDLGHEQRQRDAHQRARHRRAGPGLRPHEHGHPGPGLDGPGRDRHLPVRARERDRELHELGDRDRDAADRPGRDGDRHRRRDRDQPGDLDREDAGRADDRRRDDRHVHDQGHELGRRDAHERRRHRRPGAGLRAHAGGHPGPGLDGSRVRSSPTLHARERDRELHQLGDRDAARLRSART